MKSVLRFLRTTLTGGLLFLLPIIIVVVILDKALGIHASRSYTPLGTASIPASSTQFQMLMGRWLRPDGGYIIDIRSVDSSGKMDAAYLNPQPIHVARAEAEKDSETVNVSIELHDVNYPGSTYSLTYDTADDHLKGTYFHAALNQTFDVLFLRMKS